MGNFSLRDSTTGSDFADFLLGLPTLYTQGFSPAFYERSKYAGIYAQDSWRITPNLTLNYGLRWDLIMPWYEEHNQTGTLIPGEQSVVFPTAPTGYVFPGDPGVPTTIAPTRYNNFSPRLGLAYSPAWKNGFLKKLTGGPGNSSIPCWLRPLLHRYRGADAGIRNWQRALWPYLHESGASAFLESAHRR